MRDKRSFAALPAFMLAAGLAVSPFVAAADVPLVVPGLKGPGSD